MLQKKLKIKTLFNRFNSITIFKYIIILILIFL